MSMEEIPRYLAYTGDGVSTTFAFPFRVFSAGQLQVYVDNALAASGYTVTGVNDEAGGSVVFFSPPSTGSRITLLGDTDVSQETDYDASASSPFSATGHEFNLDKLTAIVQELLVALGLRPAFGPSVPSNLRNMALPTPQALRLLGWNASADGLTNFVSTLQQVTVSNTAHLAYAENTVTVPAVGGAVQLEAENAFPAGVIKLCAIVRVDTDFGNTGGLSTFSAGSEEVQDLWGGELARTSTVAPEGANNPGLSLGQYEPTVNAESVFLTADTGTFDADGEAIVTTAYLTMAAA